PQDYSRLLKAQIGRAEGSRRQGLLVSRCPPLEVYDFLQMKASYEERVRAICYPFCRREEGHDMTRFIVCIVTLALVNVVEVQAQGYLDGLMNRATESAKRKAQDRVNQNIDQSIDKAIKKTEDTVKCVATDQECLRHAK